MRGSGRIRSFADISLFLCQAALEHLESIIVYPPGLEPKENDNGINGDGGDSPAGS